MKTLNSILSFIIVICLIDHVTMMSLLLSGLISYSPALKISGYVSLCMIIFHAVYGFVCIYKGSRGKAPAENSYWYQNKTMAVQRISAIAMVLLILLHTAGKITSLSVYGFVMNKHIAGLMFLWLLAFCVALHIWLSIPKAAVSIGLIRGKISTRVWNLIAAVLAVLLFVSIIISSMLYFGL